MEPFQEQHTIHVQKTDTSGLMLTRWSIASFLVLTIFSIFLFLFLADLESERLASTTSATSIPVPALTPEIASQLEAHPTFEALVSYTDRGFEPMRLVVFKGDTVRFTNNSSRDLWVASSPSESATYPGESVCGATALDSCRALAPREFWQLTFEHEGEWKFRNNASPRDTGVVEVQ